jgi:membrane protease subunit HflK
LSNHKNSNQSINQNQAIKIMSNKANNIFGGKFFNQNNNPWGNSDGSNENPSRNSEPNKGQKINPEPVDFIDEAIKKGQEFLKEILGGGNGGGNSKKSNNSGNKTPKSIFGLIIGGLFVLWLSSGIYKINSDQNGLVLYFGKFHTISTPGLNYHIPTPFGKVIKKSVTRVNTEEFGFDSGSKNSRGRIVRKSTASSNAESLMLTGDENIVDIDFQIQWQISDIKDFIFNLEDPELAIRKASESAIREIIARTPIADALSDGKKRIEQETRTLLQEILDSYGAGVRIVLVQMRRVDPPSQVIDAFRDVQTAKADKEREINQAESYKNDIIPRAKGRASQITENALAYKSQVVADAEGQASRFNAIYAQYARSKVVTKKRMYMEQMEKVYSNIEKVIVDKNISRTGAIPYLPINTNIKSK